MIIGRQFAIGHIPKCGGDALHQWCSAIRDQDLVIDSLSGSSKHDLFSIRPEAMGKQFYVLAMRRLPEWTLSLLHEDSTHPHVVSGWGFASANEILSPEAAFRHSYADYHLSKMRVGVTITHWLRTGATLFDDLLATLNEVFRELTLDEVARMRDVIAKTPRPYCHEVRDFWSLSEIETLYKLNPQWSAIENMVFGGLW